MKKLNTFVITSKLIEKLHIPSEANIVYFNETSLESARQKIQTRLSSLDYFKSGVCVSVEEIQIPRQDFDLKLFEEQNIKILCYVGFSYPRYFKGQEIHCGCWGLYEFGDWGKNQNIYYNTDGTYLKTEYIK